MITCCVTGHRPMDLWGYDRTKYVGLVDLLKATTMALYDLGIRSFISGGAQGVDQLFFWAVEYLKKEHNEVENLVFVPCIAQEKMWPENTPFGQVEYRKMLELAKERNQFVLVQGTEYTPQAMQNRNLAMLSEADIVVGVYKNSHESIVHGNGKGGTFHCLTNAYAMNKCIFLIDPFKLTTGVLTKKDGFIKLRE